MTRRGTICLTPGGPYRTEESPDTCPEDAMSLREMTASPTTTIDEIAAWLDGLSHDERLAQMYSMGRSDQRALWAKCADSPAITREHFVPAGTADQTEVIHHGINTLPVFRKFQKRFCSTAADGEIGGYNEGILRPIIGPGYYVLHETAGNPDWEARGTLVVDYFMIPDGAVVDGWPRVKPNSSGLQVLIYNKTRDFMRRVSAHVSIGEAFKVEKPLNSWFMLCREDRG